MIKTDRKFNKDVRDLFEKFAGNRSNIHRFNNGVNGIVWKSYGWSGYKEIWESIIDTVEDGWELFEGGSMYGDGSVYGMRKRVTDPKKSDLLKGGAE